MREEILEEIIYEFDNNNKRINLLKKNYPKLVRYTEIRWLSLRNSLN